MKTLLAGAAILMLAGWTGLEAADNDGAALLWMVLTPSQDARDSEMVRFDNTLDAHLAKSLNTSELFKGRLKQVAGSIDSLQQSPAAFASLHYDSIRPMTLTESEKKALEQFLAKGGFLLLVEDNYPYTDEQLGGKKKASAYDFLLKELPAKNPDFVFKRIDHDHPIYNQFHKVEIPPEILELARKIPGYRGETILEHQGRLVCYVLPLYGYYDEINGGGFIPITRPFEDVLLIEGCYYLLVNVYGYAMTH